MPENNKGRGMAKRFKNLFCIIFCSIKHAKKLFFFAKIFGKKLLILQLKINCKIGINLEVNRNHDSTTKEANFSPPPGFEPWSPGTESQCTT